MAYSGFCVFLERVGRNRDKSTWPQFNASRGQACAVRLRHTREPVHVFYICPVDGQGGKGEKVSRPVRPVAMADFLMAIDLTGDPLTEKTK